MQRYFHVKGEGREEIPQWEESPEELGNIAKPLKTGGHFQSSVGEVEGTEAESLWVCDKEKAYPSLGEV